MPPLYCLVQMRMSGQLLQQRQAQRLAGDMHISALRRFSCIGMLPVSHAPLAQHCAVGAVHHMTSRDHALIERDNTQAFDGLTGLLQSEAVTLSASGKIAITLIQGKRNTTVQTGHRQCHAANPATNNSNVWIVFSISYGRMISRAQARPKATRTNR